MAQYNLFLAYNPAASEQSYIISDPGYTTLDAQIPFKWSGTEETETASLQVIKAGAGGAPLEGAEFTLTGDGGTTVTGTTDRNGQIVWRDLPADEKYTLTETAAPEGYQIVAPMNVTLTPGRTEYLTVTDDVEHGFTIKKVDAQNKGSLQGAVFRFEQIDGSYMTTGITGFDGTISFEGDELPYGSYRVTEQTPPQGYVKSSRVETVEWDGTKDVTIVWENVRDISLTIIKVDEQTGVSLADATFDVFADGKLITSVTTNDNGEARVTGIRKEAYIEIVETAAPAGYVLDKTPHGIHIDPYDPATEDDPVLTITNRARPALRIDVEIEHAGQIVKAAMTNKSLYTNVSIEKTGYAEVMPGQNIRYTFSKIGNNSTTALTSFYWRDTLPVEAVRLAKITTGTYNAAGSYKIVYKTNLSGADYRVLADSLNTQQNYVLEASPVALRLASNEYVTEVMFVFGVVPANFRQVEAPKIDCTVVSWAKGGSQFVNQADVGGVYNGQWIMATTRWVTKVYAPPKRLPTTGY